MLVERSIKAQNVPIGWRAELVQHARTRALSSLQLPVVARLCMWWRCRQALLEQDNNAAATLRELNAQIAEAVRQCALLRLRGVELHLTDPKIVAAIDTYIAEQRAAYRAYPVQMSTTKATILRKAAERGDNNDEVDQSWRCPRRSFRVASDARCEGCGGARLDDRRHR
jgi:hypothetical protein